MPNIRRAALLAVLVLGLVGAERIQPAPERDRCQEPRRSILAACVRSR